MSNSVTDENEQLSLLDILGFPSNQMLFNPLSKSIIYSLGSNIISYNLISNSKTFVQYLTSEIILLKFLDESTNILLTIDNSSLPLLCLWELPLFRQIYFREINIASQNSFSISNIFFEKIYQDIYFIIITSDIGINYLYLLKNENEINNNYNLELFGKLPYIKEIIFGFKAFYNSNDIIFLLERNLLYYSLDLDKESCEEKIKIDFPFSLINDSLRINKDINIIAFLTTKGNCLIYDQNGNNKPSINPYGQEYFTSIEFESYSICLGTNNGKIYVYSIYDNKPRFLIHYKTIIRIKNNFQLNSRDNIKNKNIYDDKDDNNIGPGIKYIYINEKIDQVFLRLEDNSIIFSPLSILSEDSTYQYNNSINNNFIFYAFNHCKNIDDIIINNCHNIDFDNNSNSQNNINDLIIFSCSKDQKLIRYYVDCEMNKLSNSYFNLNEILSNNQYKGKIISSNSNKFINRNINDNMIYLSVLKYHPIYYNKLFAGDNKGFLYLFDINENKFQYKKPIMGTYEIVFLEFSPDGEILCIGFDTGCQIFCDMKRDCEICLQINSHYMPVEETEFRKINNQIICFSYFFKNKEKNNDCFLYNKNNYLLEYCKLFYDKNKINKKEIRTIKVMNQILDIKMHISENYIIILNNTNHVIIYHILSGIITAVIDLNTHVKNANNIQIDNSGLFLGIICELYNYNENSNINKYIYMNSKNSKNKRNYVIFFEIGTGKIKTYINYNYPISKIIFDNSGNYLIISGQKGEISLWKLSESMTNNIKYVLEEMKTNINFWEEYEIKYDNNYSFKNELVNNSDYAINNRTSKIISHEIKQIKHEIEFNNKNYEKQEIKNSVYTKSNVENSFSNYFRRSKNKNESERNNEYVKKYYNTDNLININKIKENDNNIINKSELSNNYNKNYTSIEEKYKNYNNFKYFDVNEAKRAPLLIDSKEILKEINKENYKDFSKSNINEIFLDNDNSKINLDYKVKNINNKDEFNNREELEINEYKNAKKINDKKIDYNSEEDKLDNKNNNLNDGNNLNLNTNNKKNNTETNSFYKNNLTENINKNKENNGIPFNYKNNKSFQNKSILYKNNITISKSNSNMNISKPKKYSNINKFTQRIPKLKHINLVNSSKINKNIFEENQTINNKNNNLISSNENKFSSIEKKEIIRQNNIQKAINRLLENHSPMNMTNFEKQNNIELTINTQNNQQINIKNDNKKIKDNNYYNNIKNKNESINNMNEDFVVINNQKIDLNKYQYNKKKNENIIRNNTSENNHNNLIISEIKNKFGLLKKYPEPDNIDDNLINSNLEPIPDLEQHHKIEKIDLDELNQVEHKNIQLKISKKNSIKKNNNNLKSQKNFKEDENNKINQSNNNEVYTKNIIIDDNNLFKSYDEEFNEKNDKSGLH